MEQSKEHTRRLIERHGGPTHRAMLIYPNDAGTVVARVRASVRIFGDRVVLVECDTRARPPFTDQIGYGHSWSRRDGRKLCSSEFPGGAGWRLDLETIRTIESGLDPAAGVTCPSTRNEQEVTVMAKAKERGGMLLERPSDRAGRARWAEEKSKRDAMKSAGTWPPKDPPKRKAKPKPTGRPKPAEAKPARSRRPRTGARGLFDGEPSGYDSIADYVRKVAENKGVGPADLARMATEKSGGELRVLREQLSYWFNGQRPLRSDLLVLVLAALDLHVGVPGNVPVYKQPPAA